MSDTREMTPGDRRELRSLVKKQFAVLRNDVKRRQDEMRGEIEAELLREYRAQDQAISEARDAQQRAYNDYVLALRKIADDLRLERPELNVEVGHNYGRTATVSADDPNRGQVHRAAIAAIPQTIAAAATKLDQEELDLLRDLTVGALDSDQARQFLGRIPTVGALVPTARLAEIEGSVER